MDKDKEGNRQQAAEEATKKANALAWDKLAPFQALSLKDWEVFEQALNKIKGER